jgi:hypothetical protein
MTAGVTERKLLAQIEPYVLLSATALITCAYQHSSAVFDLLSRPQVLRATAHGGRVEFEVPDWFPIEESLLSVADSGIHSMVKHLALKRTVESGTPARRIHRFELGLAQCNDGDSVSLTYCSWFRFAAPPYRFEVGTHVAAYVAAALRQRVRVSGLNAQLDVKSDLAVLWLSDRLRIELLGAAMLTDVSILLDGDDTHLSFVSPQLTVARRMFPDVYSAMRRASEAGERFRGAALLIEDDRALLHGDRGASNVQT